VSSNLVSDPGLPTLPDIFHAVTIGEILGRVRPDRWGSIQEIAFTILKHHRGRRCTLEIAVRTPAGEDSLIGKVYATDRSDVYRAMEAIRRSGFGYEDEFSIPEPLGYIPGLRLLLQEKVHGPRAKVVVLSADASERAEAAARAARWLARFHASAPRSGCVTPFAEQLDAIQRWSDTIAGQGEPFAFPARRLARRLMEEAASLGGGDLCAGHGSYACHQIILAEGRTVTVDWDGYDLADPCRDVARFIVALERLALKYLGSIRALDAAAEVFLQTYQALSPLDVAAKLPWYGALTCLRLAKYEANRLVCDFPEGIAGLLVEGLRLLKEPHHAQAGG
jgi:aminoglycoside phosphotransferase (APT) family kinase protein